MTGPRPAMPINFFDSLERIKSAVAGKKVFFFLDYDGTLTPIVATPDLAVLAPDMREQVEALSKKYTVSIVSGRATDDVKSKVKIANLFYAGSHGLEIVSPNGHVTINDEAAAIRPIVDEAHARLHERLAPIKGALAEHVKYTISAHYRLVADEDVSRFEQIVDEILAQYPRLRKSHGKKVFELKPKIDWNKGAAVRWILHTLTAGAQQAVSIYIGDDTTDEDAFAVIAEHGLGILVADPPRETTARYVVRDTGEVKKALAFFMNLR